MIMVEKEYNSDFGAYDETMELMTMMKLMMVVQVEKEYNSHFSDGDYQYDDETDDGGLGGERIRESARP